MIKSDDATAVAPQRRQLRTALLVSAVVGLVGAVAIVGLTISQTFSGAKIDLLEFDSAQWQAASREDGTHDSVRLRMADSFLAGQRPIGKSRAQIVALLGEPDDTPYFRHYDMVYYLGPERGWLSVDSEWLVFKLREGVVAEARLVTD